MATTFRDLGLFKPTTLTYLCVLDEFSTWVQSKGVRLYTPETGPGPIVREPVDFVHWFTGPPEDGVLKVYWHHDYPFETRWIVVWANMLPTLVRLNDGPESYAAPEASKIIPTEAGHVYLFADWLYQHATPPGVGGSQRWFARAFAEPQE